MVHTQSRQLETRVKLVRCSPIKNDRSTDRTFKIRDKFILGPSVNKFFVMLGVSTQYMLSRPKKDKDDPSIRNEIENVFTVRT